MSNIHPPACPAYYTPAHVDMFDRVLCRCPELGPGRVWCAYCGRIGTSNFVYMREVNHHRCKNVGACQRRIRVGTERKRGPTVGLR